MRTSIGKSSDLFGIRMRGAATCLLRLAFAAGIILFFAIISRAGGPKNVAGTTFFQATATGQPLVWPQGQITYFTDQGDLSPLLPNAAANSFVADAFSQWTAIPTAALAAASGGQLAEDVNGTNVTVNSNQTISMPADIQPSATGTPVGVVYDFDGTVTDALLGAGAGDASQCFYNAAYGGDDNFGVLGTFQHALIVINGQCAVDSSQLVEVEYRLVRVIGRVAGLDWSQANLNVITGNPPATSADVAGFPVMHYTDPISCVPITRCYANPFQLAMDDVAALSRLYPVTADNLSNFPGKQVFASTTARIHGSVWFTDPAGNPAQPMQGVNVVARWIDPATNQPSGQFVASSVSGFRFTGNAGNAITGLNDSLGNPFSDWGSTSPSLEGFYDLGGLQLPDGGSAQYQLSAEPLDPTWSAGVGSYAPFLVAPSGSFSPVVLTVAAGQDVQQDVLMLGAAQPIPPWAASETWTAPAPVPTAGAWEGSLSSYGDAAYFLLPVQGNRTVSVAVTALDEASRASEEKSQPVLGIWTASDPQGTPPPAFTSSPFNTVNFGMTRLDAEFSSSSNFLIGIADLRGDGRPDYHYAAQVLYADSVAPARVSVAGGPVVIHGTGFAPGLTAAVGPAGAPQLALSAGELILAAPPQSDGPQSITVANPATGGSTTMTNALTYGAAARDNLVLITGLNSNTPVGTQAVNPVKVQVVAADGVTAVAGATIAWSATNGVQLSSCNGTSSCSTVTDQSGYAFTWITPAAAGTAAITAALAPATYSPAKSVTATLNATESPSDIGVMTPLLWIAQGASVNVLLTARVLSHGTPTDHATVNFTVVAGTGTLGANSAQTNTSGFAEVTLSVTQISSLVQVSACVAPANAPCQTFYLTPVPLSALNLQPVAGAGQISTGSAFQPIAVRVTDSATPPDPVMAAQVLFTTTVLRSGGSGGGGGGENDSQNSSMPVILAISQNTVSSDASGMAALIPSTAGFAGPLEVDVSVTAGTGASLDDPLQVVVPPVTAGSGGTSFPPITRPVGVNPHP